MLGAFTEPQFRENSFIPSVPTGETTVNWALLVLLILLFMGPTTRAPEKVDVAVVELALKYGAVTFPVKYPLPATSNGFEGEVVPMPTLPPRVARYVAPVEVNEVVEALPSEVWPVVVKVCEPRSTPVVAPVYGTYVAAAVPVPSNPNDEVDTADTAPLVPQRRPEREPTERPPVVVVPVMERAAKVGDDPVPMA